LNCSAVLGDVNAERHFKPALPGYTFSFPADHYSHEEYKTEWWYYTGHLLAKSGEEFGFELTFFRSGVPIADGVSEGPWSLKNMYMGHFAMSDLQNKRFYHLEKMSRGGVASAGASDKKYEVWTENWSAMAEGKDHRLQASSKDCVIDLKLGEGKPPAIHGENGVSQKANCVGCASHYYSLTRMPVSGKIKIADKNFEVDGIAWMDHEFGSNQLGSDQVGWDWYSIQLDDQTELMLYVMRLKNGKVDPNSSGTFIRNNGGTTHLPLSSYKIDKTATWKSPHTNANYPSRWHVSLPSLKLELDIVPQLADQELASENGGISYWEGACTVNGLSSGKPIKGKAYVELTGYDKDFNRKI
jgi:predicted secreted hydrolase